MSHESLRILTDEFYSTYFAYFPGEATQAGDHRFDGRLGCYSRDSVIDLVATLKTLRGRVESVERDGLGISGENELLTLLSQIDEVLIRVDGLDDFSRNPCNYLPLDDLNALVIRTDRPLEERAGHLVNRLKQYPRVVAEGMQNLERPPQVFIDVAMEQASASLEFLQQTIPDLARHVPPALGRDIKRSASAAASATEDFITFLRKSCLPWAGTDFAAGRDLYDRLLREWHLLPYTGEEIIEPAGMRYLDIIEKLRKEYPAPQAVTRVYAETVEELRRYILDRGIVDIPASDNLEVKVTPSFLRPFYPTNGYEPSPVLGDGDTAAFYWVTLPPRYMSAEQRADYLGEHTYHIIPSVTAHETYPGHHLYSLYARQCSSRLRKLAYSPLADEGWAFYTEEMMDEQGFLDTDEQRFFRLKDQLFRAVRASIDVEMHYGRLSLQAAAGRFVEQVRLSPEVALSEVANYAMGPTHAICYLVGKTEIKRLRRRYLEQCRTGCLREFHTRFLENGMIPVSLIERELFASRA